MVKKKSKTTVGKKRVKRGPDTRQHIVKIARKLFGTNGYSATSLKEISDKALVTTGAVYHHFGDKKGLFFAVSENVAQDILSQLSDRVGELKFEFDVLEAAIVTSIDICTAEDIQQIITRDQPTLFTREKRRGIELRHSYGLMRAAVIELAEDKIIKTNDPEMLASMLLSMILEAAATVATSKRPKKKALREAQNTVVTMLRSLKIN